MNKFCTRLGKWLDGLKALLSGSAFLLLTMADYFQVIPIQPLMEHYLGIDNALPVILFWGILISSIRYALGKKEPFHSDDAFSDPEAHSSEPF